MVGVGQVVRIAGFARLEVDVGVLRGAAHARDGRAMSAAVAVRAHQILVDHGAQIVRR